MGVPRIEASSMKLELIAPTNHRGGASSGTQVARAGNLIFVGGQISADDKARAVGADMATQARNVFNFIRKVLHDAGLEESDAAKLYTYYHADGSWAEIARKVLRSRAYRRNSTPSRDRYRLSPESRDLRMRIC